MRQARGSRLATLLGLAALLALLAATFARAYPKQCVGEFTLTSEIRWGRAVLPPGNYSFELDVTDDLIIIRGEKQAVIVRSLVHDTDTHLQSSALILVSRGRRGTVRALQLAQQKVVLLYAVPKENPEEVAQGPLIIQRVPVTINGM